MPESRRGVTLLAMLGFRWIAAVVAWLISMHVGRAAGPLTDTNPLRLPEVESCRLRVLTPTLLELARVTTKARDAESVTQWNFVDPKGTAHLPSPHALTVTAGDRKIPIERIGFKRRVRYAPLKRWDLRIGNYIYLVLAAPVNTGDTVRVTNPDQKLWPPEMSFVAKADPLRRSPAIHVNQTGYLPSEAKIAMVGYYLGSLGEMELAPSNRPPHFEILGADSSHPAFEGTLTLRPDQGFPYPCYQRVLQADFTSFNTPGQYRLVVPGLGASFPFFIRSDVVGAFARTYALGLYHQRCGTSNSLPFTRFTHGPCHTAPAAVPDDSPAFAEVNDCLNRMTTDTKESAPRQTAPRLKDVSACLYPFVRHGKVDVSGGHHDAGDYSKYTINSAALIHFLVFAADAFPGVSDLDNLGLPESGDGKSDVLEEAKWEADFLAKMQDTDGGFYFLVYPRDREYEIDVTPDHGDPQVVFPKTTSATAAAVAALAQCASSPTFKKEFPAAAAEYLRKAKLGWAFLERAIARYGQDGSYQKITHYGNDFIHDDELTWAACEMYLATGDPDCRRRLEQWLHPDDPNTRLWGWWRLYASYGAAIRSYAFAARTGRVKPSQLDPILLEHCEDQIIAAGQDQLHRTEASAYGTAFPIETKRAGAGGWYFSSDAAFDLAVAYQLDYPIKRDPRPAMMRAILSNLNYEEGCNPVNVTYLTGLGWKRQHEIVDQYAENDRRALPPSGIPLGNIQASFGWLDLYGHQLSNLSFPRDDSPDSPYPIYDRWSDAFNLTQEFVVLNQARALGYLAWLMARSPLKHQAWRAEPAAITGIPKLVHTGTKLTATLAASLPSSDLADARIVWEGSGLEPVFGPNASLEVTAPGPQWIEAEAQLPDGRRLFGVLNFQAVRP